MSNPTRVFGRAIMRIAEMIEGIYDKTEIHPRAFYKEVRMRE
jgi:hypothetical protein